MPKLLDLFCGGGGAGYGYHQAGFEVVGVDLEPQKHYPFEFHQADAFEYLAEHWQEFDAIHASPPCEGFSKTRAMRREYANAHYIDLLTPVRAKLTALPIPWVIENVPGAPGPWDLLLCGTMFQLKGRSPVHRHRLFQASFRLDLPPFACSHTERAMNVYTSGEARNGTEREFCDALGVIWANVEEGMKAIPPAYTRFVGEQLRLCLT